MSSFVPIWGQNSGALQGPPEQEVKQGRDLMSDRIKTKSVRCSTAVEDDYLLANVGFPTDECLQSHVHVLEQALTTEQQR